MIDYLIIFLFTLFISFSFVGYGAIINNFIDKKLLNINIGYTGLSGLFFCTILSYITIFFLKHGYIHNVIIHFVGLSSFIFFLIRKKLIFKLSNIY